MARVTSEKAIKIIGSQFELVVIAGHRARQIDKGDPPRVDPRNDKSHVVAVREIEEGKYTKEEYYESLNAPTKIEKGEEDEY